jgi:class 3 adenylate cyclase/tetratricopeptide (TPR) repeat protein
LCPSCGNGNPPGNKFCGHCGSSLDRASPVAEGGVARPGEIRQVTLFFCDIVNSTPLTERLGPEGMRDLVHAFLDTSIAEVRRYGGTAPQFTGDGFLALFGAPLTHEDHVRRALLAALSIQRVLSGREPDGLDLPVRIGLHTGPVVFGRLGEHAPVDATVIGDTAVVAARLQTAAEPGTIVVSAEIGRLAQGYARLEPVGPFLLKGKAEPVAAYRLLGVSHRRVGLRDTPSPRPAGFVNRTAELAMLHDALRRVEAGHGQAVGLVGEPGIGKSRLVAEFRRQLDDGRVTWVDGRCLSYGTGIPYVLALDLLRSHCGIGEADPPDLVAEKVRAGLAEVGMDPAEDAPVLLHLLDVKEAAAAPGLANPEAVKAKAFETFRRLGVKASLLRPVVLLLEDLHWIDRISEELIGYLAENFRETRLLLLATYRAGYRPPWIDKSYGAQIPLQPLSREDSANVVRSVLRAEDIVELVTREIVAKADGNPLFLEQLALHAGEAPDLRSGLLVPGTIHDVVMARIDRLPDETKRILQTAAVIGREFPLRLLEAVWRGKAPLEDHLRELARLEFVYERIESEGPVFVFRHALTQETAYGSLLERHRRSHHGAVGRALEALYHGRAEEVAELLALHFGRSEETETSVDYAILAAEKSQRRWANTEAVGYFGDALQRLDRLPDSDANRRRRIDAVIKQAEVRFALGQHAEHISTLDRIRELIDRSDDPHRRATWHYWRGFLHSLTGGRPEIAIEHCNEAATLAAAAGLDEVEAFAQSCLAQVYLITGRLREAIEAGDRALAMFETLGNLWWAGRTIAHLSPAAISLGEWEAGLGYCRKVLDYGAALKDLRLRVVGLWRIGATYIQQGDPQRGIDCCNEALALGPLPYDEVMTKAVRGYGEVRAGRAEAGVPDLAEAVAWFEHSGLRYTRQRFALWLAEGMLCRGDRTAARPLLDDVLEKCRRNGYVHYEALTLWLEAECLAPETPAEAEPQLEAALAIFGRIGARNDLARAMLTRAALRQVAGDAASAAALLAEADLIFRRLGTLDEPARVAAARAALARGAPIGLLGGGRSAADDPEAATAGPPARRNSASVSV